MYSYKHENSLTVYVDAYWVRDTSSRQPVWEMVTILAGAVVSWCFIQQEVAALASSEVKYISYCYVNNDTIWTRRPINATGFVPDVKHPTAKLADNQGRLGLFGTSL